MAAQSDIQSLLQNLSGVHSAGQAFVPSSVNNGNPNTAYNQPAPTGMFIPPETNSFGNWKAGTTTVPQASPSQFQGPNWQAMSAAQPAAKVPGGFNGFPNVLEGAGVGWAPDAVGVGTPPPPTTGGNPPGGMQTGGNDPATPAGGSYGTFRPKFTDPNDPILNQGLSGGRGLDLLDLGTGFVNGLYSNDQTPGSVSGSEFGSAFQSLGDMNVNLGVAGSTLAGTSLGRALGITQSGSINVAQIADFFIPGNVFMSQTQQTNWANAIPALASAINPLLGLAVTKIMNTLGAKYAAQNDSDLGGGLAGRIRRMLRNRYIKNQANRQAGQGAGGGGHGEGGGFGGGFGSGGFGDGWGVDFGHAPTGVNIQIGGNNPGEISDQSQ